MSSYSDTKLFIVNVPSKSAAKALNSLFAAHGVSAEWDGDLMEVSAGDDFISGCAREFSPENFDDFIAIANHHGLRLAAQMDMSNGTSEDSIAAVVSWADGCTKTTGDYSSETNSFRPVFTVEDALKLAKSGASDIAEIFEALEAPLPTFMIKKLS